MQNSIIRRLLASFLPLFLFGVSDTTFVSAALEPPAFPFPLAAPWPAGVTLHGGDEGYGYGGATHQGYDEFAMDFNGNPAEDDPPVETNDRDLLVLAIADGCVKEVKYSPGRYVQVQEGNELKNKWYGDYGWNIVISHAGGFESRYAHLKDKPLITEGKYDLEKCEFVSQGQPLGQIGGTGTEKDTGVHLHLALYYCEKVKEKCNILAARPEPLDGAESLPSDAEDAVQVKSQNYSVGYEEIKGNALTQPASLVRHKAIVEEYRSWGGQYGFFGRATGPVTKIPGTNIFYQEFKPYGLPSSFGTAIVEVEARAYMLPQPIWDLFKSNYLNYGNPNSSYISEMGELGNTEIGLRTDFQFASIFWNWNLTQPIVWDEKNAPWKVLFCPGTDNFSCNPVRRRDPAIDFHFLDSNNPGPLYNVEGFSALWQASLDEKLVSKISLEYQIQGNARFYIDDKVQGDWIRSEDEDIQGITTPTWHVGGNTFVIRFWQSPGKTAHLSLKVHETGFTLIPKVFAFESQGTLTSSVHRAQQPEYIDFEPPPYPVDPGVPQIPSTESQSEAPTEIAPGFPDIPPFEMPDIGKWWDYLVKNLQDRVDQWWQDLTKDLQRRLEEELLKILTEALDSLVRQCSGSSALVLALGVGVFIRKRYRQ
jgi:hypothetical protein